LGFDPFARVSVLVLWNRGAPEPCPSEVAAVEAGHTRCEISVSVRLQRLARPLYFPQRGIKTNKNVFLNKSASKLWVTARRLSTLGSKFPREVRKKSLFGRRWGPIFQPGYDTPAPAPGAGLEGGKARGAKKAAEPAEVRSLATGPSGRAAAWVLHRWSPRGQGPAAGLESFSRARGGPPLGRSCGTDYATSGALCRSSPAQEKRAVPARSAS
jgi:hypothetical protein